MLRLILLALLLAPSAAQAHGGLHAVPAGPIGWTLDPSVTVPLAVTLAIYVAGLIRLRARRSLFRGAILFLTGWLVLALALVSPLHEAGERSFALHMIEHELIMLVAALLIPLSQPLGVMLWAFPRSVRQSLATGGRPLQRLASPGVATALQAIALWVWHAPPLFNRALGHPAWHVAQHLSFLVTALLFWWAMLRTPNRGLAALCLFITSIIGGALGALMALSASPWYAQYAAMQMMPFGLTPSEDQALAGLVMWVPGGLVHAGAAILLLHKYLNGEGAPSGSAMPAGRAVQPERQRGLPQPRMSD
jgi:cytochrome c oxidase assembly factor CtaG